MRTGLLLVGLLVAGACTVRSNDGDIDVDPITDRIGEWESTLTARNDSGVRGAAAVYAAGVGSQVSISIAGSTPNAHHPWHVHRGTCATGGAIVGDRDAYPPLHVGSDGAASGTATISVGLDENTEYHVNVHKSATEMGTAIACGNLTS
ncbi:MAG: hypothetical protein WEF86_13225 [Gemmatimonadota bacterium]